MNAATARDCRTMLAFAIPSPGLALARASLYKTTPFCASSGSFSPCSTAVYVYRVLRPEWQSSIFSVAGSSSPTKFLASTREMEDYAIPFLSLPSQEPVSPQQCQASGGQKG
eukprot:GEMP01021525.1.p5 GENE.GEMP01021525.1~~GEMP01021525.1.p5  ORF type:complete len:112 (-),score=16.45 GEMP01021525.1:677-1012(-)